MSPSQGIPGRIEVDEGVEAAGDGAGMMACFCSLSIGITFRFARYSGPFAQSRNRTIAACSAGGGTRTGICLIPGIDKSH
jgi:hypothetical protein